MLNSSIDEGKALWHVGAGSQPGSATQIWPLSSKAIPQGVARVGTSMKLEARVLVPMLAKIQTGAVISRVVIAMMRTMIPRDMRTVFTMKSPFHLTYVTSIAENTVFDGVERVKMELRSGYVFAVYVCIG